MVTIVVIFREKKNKVPSVYLVSLQQPDVHNVYLTVDVCL